ncbi:hypothetical protein CANINC_004709 [Pichia inconspicua]|uniref:Cytochrome b5 heme-binding domain-containing protein n=1 Tax=Pichia inconspicua TaxID=52247 RepID=A0A4T0WX74_9ASCO|nr:hypothetical protein CANINC_004709 [[Candida] inconspicua]
MFGISVLDITRVLSGLLLLNALVSYTLTNSSTWGYSGKYVDTQYLLHLLRGAPLRKFTLSTLAEEVNVTGRLLISVNRTVFDVTASRDIYDPNRITARYKLFVGRDCTRMYVNGCFRDEEQCSWDIRNTGFDDEWVNKTVKHWVDFYSNHRNYWIVGYLDVSQEESLDTPPVCLNGLRYPVI